VENWLLQLPLYYFLTLPIRGAGGSAECVNFLE